MFTVFSTALSALNADSTAVDVVGNNLANLNTVGFKASDVMFYDLVNQAIGNPNSAANAGLGVLPPSITQVYSQGAIQSTDGPLDAAIQGDGFFVVNDSNGNQFYTRNGSFTVNSDGTLVTQTGQAVQGWSSTTGKINTNGPIGNIVVPSGTLQDPVATQNLSLQMNLDSTATVNSPASPNFSQTIQVYDSLGNTHDLTFNFTKTAANSWSYEVDAPGSDLTAGTAGTPSQLATGTLTFDSQGHLLTPDATTPAVAINLTGLASGAADMSVNWNLYDSTGNTQITQVASPSAVASNTQDGSAAAELLNVSMGPDGQITANYSNSESKVVGQLALANIQNPDSLLGAGDANLKASALTALPSIGTAETGGRGSIQGGALESSTVDIAREFTNLIVLQRAYEANGKVVTAADQLSQDTINLKQT